MKKTLFVFLTLAIISGCALKHITVSHDTDLNCCFLDDGTLVIEDNKAVVTFPKAAGVLVNMPEPPQILSIKKHNNNYFVLTEISKWSRGTSTPKGYCGCGIEVFLIWINFTDKELFESKEHLIHSCLYNIIRGTCSLSGDLLYITSQNLVDIRDVRGGVWREITYSYDTKHPAVGIMIAKKPLMLLDSETGKWHPYTPK